MPEDHFGFYQAIRELAPKQPYQRIQLRSSTGELLGPAASADLLQQWFTQLYDATDVPLPIGNFEWPFSEEELTLVSTTTSWIQGPGIFICTSADVEDGCPLNF